MIWTFARFALALALAASSFPCFAEGPSTEASLQGDSCALPHPRYPLDSRRNQETGVAEVRVLVESDGTPTKAEIGKSSGHELLDAAAKDWIMTCRFNPKVENAQATSTWVTVSVHFGSPRPVPAGGPTCDSAYPEYPMESRRHGETGTVTLRYLIAKDGVASRILVAKSSGFQRLDAAAKEWIMNCYFKPATENGTPLEEWSSQSFTFALKR